MTKELLTLRVNGERHTVAAEPHHTLLEVLREELQLTGTKHGCELGECGACTVLVDGVPVLSCLTLPIQVGEAEITTVEGLASAGAGAPGSEATDLHPLQTAFAEEGASFGTPGVRIGLFCSTPMVAVSRAVGRKRALQMLLTGDRIDAATAADWGLINAAVPAAELEQHCQHVARQILRFAEFQPAIGFRRARVYSLHAHTQAGHFLLLDQASKMILGAFRDCQHYRFRWSKQDYFSPK